MKAAISMAMGQKARQRTGLEDYWKDTEKYLRAPTTPAVNAMQRKYRLMQGTRSPRETETITTRRQQS